MRTRQDDALSLPKDQTLTMTVTGPGQQDRAQKDLPVSAHGTVMRELDLRFGRRPWVLQYRPPLPQRPGIQRKWQLLRRGYKKPEYQVTVKPGAPRVLQGKTIQATIKTLFLRRTGSGRKVKYVVHTSRISGDEGQRRRTTEADTGDSDDSSDAFDSTEQQEHDGVLDANGRLSINIPVAVDDKQNDMDYRIEARVTDAGNCEVSGHTTVLATYGSFRVSVESRQAIWSKADSRCA